MHCTTAIPSFDLFAVPANITSLDSASAAIRDMQTQQHPALLELHRAAATLIGVGAAFDFHTGAVNRAPVWMQRVGLDWAHRLASEPRRLWRRYLIMAPKFLIALAREKRAA